MSQQDQSLSYYVRLCLERYFESLNGSAPSQDLYKMILEQVEQPLLDHVLEYCQGNQSKTAEVLGLNRGTLRKKLKAYNLTYSPNDSTP